VHPFDFTNTISFVCDHPDSAFVFDPLSNNKFHWYGKALDKLGSYAVKQTDKLILELEWNYGREQNYPIVSFSGTGNAMTAFVLKNGKTGELYSFYR
jgi:hypothetical protein